MKIKVLKLDDLNTIVIKKDIGSRFFITTSDSVVISKFNFSSLLKFMLFKEIISPKMLEGILEEYYYAKSNIG